MSLYVVTAILTVLTSLSVGIFVFLKNPKGNVNRTWFGLSLSVALWSVFLAYMFNSKDSASGLFYSRMLQIGAILIPATFLHFIISFLNYTEQKRPIILLCYAVSGALLFFNFSPHFVKGAVYTGIVGCYYPRAGALYIFYIILYVLSSGYAAYLLIRSFLKEKGLRRNQIAYVLTASAIGFIGGSSTFPLWYDIKFPPLGTHLVWLYVLIITIAIVRYSLMDINIVITRASILALVYFVVLGIPFAVGYKLSKAFWVVPIALMAVFATAGPFIYTYLQRKAEGRLRREEFQAHQALNRLAQNMMRFTKLDVLLKLTVHQVVKIMKVNSASIYLRDEGNKHFNLRSTWSINNTHPEQNEFSEESLLVKDVLLRKSPIVLEELGFGGTSQLLAYKRRLQTELHKANAAVVIPAFKGDNLYGFLMLGVKREGRLFTQEDLNLLLLLANQAVLAIDNAQLFGVEKVLMAEKSRREALADMAPGVAHQFNNRLMAIVAAAGANAALLEQDELKKLDPKLASVINQAKDAFNTIMKDAMKGRDIATAILKKGKASVSYSKLDLAPIITSAIELLKISSTRSTLEGTPEPELILDIEGGLPKLMLNESLIQDIFYNIIDNARDAIITKNQYVIEHKIEPVKLPYLGKITITAREKDDNVVVTVQDNGIGIKKEHMNRLYVPYFTTKATAYKGTGMGLWVIRSFIEDHKGTISVESEYTKGTTFTITLPIHAKVKG